MRALITVSETEHSPSNFGDVGFLKDIPNLFDCVLVILGIVDVVVSNPFDGVRNAVEDRHVLNTRFQFLSCPSLALSLSIHFTI